MISITQVGNLYNISFKYDPELVDMIKKVPGKSWNPVEKYWTIEKSKLGFFMNQIKGTRFENQVNLQSNEDIGKNDTLDKTSHIPNIDISNVPFYVKNGSKPYQHQLDFMKYAIDRQQRGYRSGFLCADEPGLGKTIESINLAMFNRNYNNFNHCLIICNVNTSKYNWEQEVSEHTSGKMFGYLLGSRMKKKRGTKKKRRVVCGTKEKYEDLVTMHRYGDENEPELPYFIIMNVEALRMKEGKRYPITERLIEMINSGLINMIVIDEIHKNMSPTSIQGKQILKIKDKTGSRCIWLPLTGTPIVNKPTDVFLPMKLVDAHNFSSYYKWCQEFCVYGGYGDVEIVAYKNIPRMKIMLQQNMIRRLKKDVLGLPDKIHFDIFVENTKYQEKLADEVTAELYAHAGEISNSMNPMVKFLKLRQVNGSPELVDQSLKVNSQYIKYNAKLQKLFELLEEIHDRSEKVVIFSNWVEPLRTLYRFVSTKYKVCCFTGTMSEAERQKHKRVFLTNPEYTVMVGTIGALGTTHTLTSANNVIFYDEPWTYTDKLQAEDRCHRVGTNSSVNIYTLLSKDTVDERVHDIVYGKKDVAGYIVDNKLDFRNNPDLVYRLLGKDKE